MAESETPTPPYGSYATFKAFLDELRGRGSAPQLFEGSVFGSNRSGAARSHLLVALRFFGFVTPDRRPTRLLQAVLEDESGATFNEAVMDAYSAPIALQLDTATPGQLDDVFRGQGIKSADTLKKAKRFFLTAAEDTGIVVGPHLKVTQPARGGGTTTRRPRTKKPPPKPPAADPINDPPRDKLHPFIVGLLQELPTDAGTWTKSRRDGWLEMARLTVDMLYRTEPEV